MKLTCGPLSNNAEAWFRPDNEYLLNKFLSYDLLTLQRNAETLDPVRENWEWTYANQIIRQTCLWREALMKRIEFLEKAKGKQLTAKP